MGGGGGGHVNVHISEHQHISFFNKHLVHELFGIITRFFVSFIKIPVLLKIPVLKNTYFATNFQPITNVTNGSI